jgi:hypothetical protein
MVAGGVGGYQAGKLVRVGEGHIGEAHVKAPQVDANAKDRVGSFARGAFTHFNEVGPASQGVSLGYAWGMQDAVATKYSPSERAGAMHGDLGAAALLGGGALGVLAAVKMAGKNSGGAAGLASTKVGAAATAAGKVLAQGRMMGAIQKIAPMGVAGMGAAAVGIAGLTAMKEMDQARNAGVSGTGVAAIGAGVIGATAATAAMVSRSSALAGKPMAPAAAASALTAAALIGVLSSARLPLQQFMNDSKTAHAVRGETDWAVSGPMLGIGGLAGGVGALKTAQKLVPDSGFSLGKFRIPKAAIVGVATAAGAGGLGAVGYGLSATMPDVKTVGLTAAAGAAIGAGAGVALKGLGPRNGAIAGAVLGASTSSLVKQPS